MATAGTPFDGMTEHCDRCDLDTLHEVTIQIVTESDKRDNVEFSREPYRVTECQRCGRRNSQRMNNA